MSRSHEQPPRGEARIQFAKAARELFQAYDADGSGWLDEEQVATLVATLKPHQASIDAAKAMDVWDRDHSGKVTEDEFYFRLMQIAERSRDWQGTLDRLDAAIKQKCQRRIQSQKPPGATAQRSTMHAKPSARAEFAKAARDLFQAYDIDDSGFLSEEEVVALVRVLKPSQATIDAAKAMDVWDRDHSGKVTEDEFYFRLMQIAERATDWEETLERLRAATALQLDVVRIQSH